MRLKREISAVLTVLSVCGALALGCASEADADRIVGDGAIAGAESGGNDSGGSEGAASMGSSAGGAGASPSAGGFAAPESADAAPPRGSSPLDPSDPSNVDMPRPPETPRPRAGALTAGTWDDNKNFDFFAAYQTDLRDLGGRLPFAPGEHAAARASAELAPHTTLDVQLVLDTTGSMGDEIRFLQREFTALSSAIAARYPQARQRWSLVLYKDETDDVVVRWFDFRDTPDEYRAKLETASAGGGGDLPEASDRALEVAHKLSWRLGSDTARLVFWVTDAPHHVGREGRLATAIRGARDKGIHIYPVAASGVDELAEHTMRSAAQLTGGRYLFLTDDSRIGNAHKEPRLPCYFVTHLDDAMLRMIDLEMTGRYREPARNEVLRTGGAPQGGVCRLSSGQQVEIY